ncbi:MAG TPA: 4-hydroxy-tetrahydrodipicolinate synthase [Candidatus Didemnitutus sp.]|nr:4-hydroxy-tetrahydrodipicolinate synthase [Candidatus Didemnitutus sp.]
MKSPRPFTGAITALVTPFANGAVALGELRKLVDTQIKQGINGLVPVGTTGESPTLDYEEHLEVIRTVIAQARRRVPVIAGTGSNSTKEALYLTREAHTAGADAMLVVAPYYNKPTQEGLFNHFSAIAEATDRPIILYSIPGRCGVEIGVPVIERLRARYPHVNHIKEAGGTVDRVDQMTQALGDSMTVLCGDDSLTLPFMALGAKGVISVASNLYPRAVARLTSLMLEGEYNRALTLHRKLYPVFKTIFIESNPGPIKEGMARAGLLSSPEVRSPLCPLTEANRKTLFSVLDTFDGR